MKSIATLIIFGVAASIICYGTVYYFGTQSHRHVAQQEYPELAWLRVEFELSEEEFERIRKLHYAYLPKCESMCELVSEKNAELVHVMGQGTNGEELHKALIEEVVGIRADCQRMMLEHFHSVGQEMNPTQRERYLSWVLEESLSSGHQALVGGHHQK